MASANPARKEAICSICWDYLNQPVTIDCGHNFCRCCILKHCKYWRPQLGSPCSCPICRQPFSIKRLSLNRQLGDIIEVLKQLEMRESLCKSHHKELKFFSEEDGEAICEACRESCIHRAHTTCPVEEAAQRYKVRLQGALDPLKRELDQALELMVIEEEKVMEWQNKVENQRQSITHEFKKLHEFLSEAEQLLMRGLVAEEMETQQRLQGNITLEECKSAVQQLIAELGEKCQQPAAKLTEDVESILFRSENVKLHTPEAMVFPALKNICRICLDIKERLKRLTVDVTLDPDTARPELVPSEDQKRVRDGDTHQDLPKSPERFVTSPWELGADGSQVMGGGGIQAWMDAEGCRESVRRKG